MSERFYVRELTGGLIDVPVRRGGNNAVATTFYILNTLYNARVVETFGHGGAFGTQGWIDPHKDVFVVLLIQRVGLSNGDASEMRKELQKLVYDAIKK